MIVLGLGDDGGDEVRKEGDGRLRMREEAPKAPPAEKKVERRGPRTYTWFYKDRRPVTLLGMVWEIARICALSALCVAAWFAFLGFLRTFLESMR